MSVTTSIIIIIALTTLRPYLYVEGIITLIYTRL